MYMSTCGSLELGGALEYILLAIAFAYPDVGRIAIGPYDLRRVAVNQLRIVI